MSRGSSLAVFGPWGGGFGQVRRVPLERLRRGRPASTVDIAAETGTTLDELEPTLGHLVRIGPLERYDDRAIVGAHGLTLHPARPPTEGSPS